MDTPLAPAPQQHHHHPSASTSPSASHHEGSGPSSRRCLRGSGVRAVRSARPPSEQPVVRREEESEERPLPMQPEEEGFLQQLQVAFTAPELPQAIYQPYKTKATALMRDFIMGFKTGTPHSPFLKKKAKKKK